jgi:DNA-directed RNA polymerase subunit RPC12/RpoP
MAKVLEVFKDAKRHNYCDLPKFDVEILADIYLCQKCGAEVRYEAHPRGGLGNWVHVDADVEAHYAGPRSRCRYCRSQDAVYRQHAWYDAVECDRCGAVDGRAIGD